MTTKIKNPIFFLLLLSMFFTSCHSQTKTEKPNVKVVKQPSFTSKNLKLTKTQGTDEYQNVHCGLQDRQGNLWFGTTGEGVYRYDGKLFTQFTEKDGLNSNKVWSILEDTSGNIWFGTDNGISRFDGETISTVSLPVNGGAISYPNASQNNSTEPKNAVWSMMQDKVGVIWFGTDNGVFCYNGKSFSPFLEGPKIINESELTLKSVQCMFEDKNGDLWFGSGPMAFEGIALYDGKHLTNFKPQSEGWIRKIAEDKNGNLLFATRHIGVIAYDAKNFTGFSEPQNIRKDLISTILTDSKGNIWYGADYTSDNDITTGGFWRFDGKSFVRFTKKEGLDNSSVYSLTEDKVGNIWIGTRNCGLYRYDGQIFTAFSE